MNNKHPECLEANLDVQIALSLLDLNCAPKETLAKDRKQNAFGDQLFSL